MSASADAAAAAAASPATAGRDTIAKLRQDTTANLERLRVELQEMLQLNNNNLLGKLAIANDNSLQQIKTQSQVQKQLDDLEATIQRQQQEIRLELQQQSSQFRKQQSLIEATLTAVQVQQQQQQQQQPDVSLPGALRPGPQQFSAYRPTGLLNYIDDPPIGTFLGPDRLDRMNWVHERWPALITSVDLDTSLDVRPPKNCQRRFQPSLPDEQLLLYSVQDPAILPKLKVLQDALRDEHTPISAWPTRILRFLSQDFQCVERFINNYKPTWPQSVEAILTVLVDNNALSLPLSTLAVIKLHQNESYSAFAERLKTAVNNLSISLRGTDPVRELTCSILQTQVPAIWQQIQRSFLGFSSAIALVEHTKRFAVQQDQIVTQARERVTSPTAIPVPATPVALPAPVVLPAVPTTTSHPDEYAVTADDRDDDECYKCGKRGHWSKDCRRRNDRDPRTNRRDAPNHRQRPRSPKSPPRSYPKERHPRSNRDRPRPNTRNNGHSSHKKLVKFHTKTYSTDAEADDDDDYDNDDDDDFDHDEEGIVDVNNTIVYPTAEPFPFPASPCQSALLTREGHGSTHHVFPAIVNGRSTTVFLDYGSTCCWTDLPDDAVPAIRSDHPTTLSGVGGTGAAIETDAQLRFKFVFNDGSLSPTLSVVCGVVPPRTFPGSITLGRSIFHRLQMTFLRRDRVSLRFPHKMGEIRGKPTTYRAGACTVSAEDFVDKLKAEYAPVFAPKPGHITGVNSRVQHVIQVTEGSQAVRTPPRRYSRSQLAALKAFCQAGLDNGVIQRVGNDDPSPWSSQAHLVPKTVADKAKFKTNREDLSIIYRVCIDYRPLNRVTVKHAFPLPNLEDQIHTAAGHRFFCLFDLLHGFWHIKMAPASQIYTAFATPFGQFKWLVMPFGLTNSPATFQALMNEVLEPLSDFTAGLIDDICLWADDLPTAQERCHRLFARLQQYGLVINLSKARWFVSEVKFLGYVISQRGYKIDPERSQAILDRPPPTTITELMSFLSAIGFVRQFICKFAVYAAPLYRLLENQPAKGSQISLTAQQFEAWQHLRTALTEAPLLRTFNYLLPCVIDADASKYAVGAALLQPSISASATQLSTAIVSTGPTSLLQPVAFFSHKLTPTQQRYSTQERELLSIVLSLQKWRHWVEGSEITVRSDHQSLSTIRTKSELPARILRFTELIEHYAPKIVYRKGAFQALPDYLSRPAGEQPSFPTDEEREEGDEQADETVGDAVENPADLTWLDVLSIAEYLRNSVPLPNRLHADWVTTRFCLLQNKLYYSPQNASDPPQPTEIREVLEYDDLVDQSTALHQNLGHLTAGALLTCVSARFWHPDLVLAVQEAIRICNSCQLLQPPLHYQETVTPLQPAEPLQRWGVDFAHIDLLRYIAAIDYATSFAVLEAVPDEKAERVVNLLDTIIARFGSPQEVISDNGTGFASAETAAFLLQHGIQRKRSSPAHPQTNGKIERFNGQLKQLYTRIRSEYNTPERTLQAAILLYNRMPQIAGFSPFFLLYGVQPRTRPGHHAAPVGRIAVAPAGRIDSAAAARLALARRCDRPPPPPWVLSQDSPTFPAYTREPTEAEDAAAAVALTELHHERLATARLDSASLRAVVNARRSYLNEQKAQIRVFEKGDWVLRVRQRRHKLEPYYDGPYLVVSANRNANVYHLETPGGIRLGFSYNGLQLYPAYTRDGQPVRSLWYASKSMLDRDRARLRAACE